MTSGPDPHRRGNSPAEVVRAGSRHAPMWSAVCLDCDVRLGWHRLLSCALAELAWHQEMHRVWRTELPRAERLLAALKSEAVA